MNQNSILVVDDDQHIINIISRALTREGYEVHTALSAEAALKLLRSSTFDLIISDQQMDGMSGIVFFEQAKKASPESIRVLVTAHDDKDTLMEAINKGEIYKFITKPFEVTDLLITVQTALEHRNLLKEKEVLLQNIAEKKEAAEKIHSLNEELSKALAEVREKNVNLEKSVNKLQETQAQLLQSEKMASIGQLAAGVAHEINNPVGFIISNLSSLKSYVSDLSLLIHKYEELKKEASTYLEGERREKVPALLEAINQCKEEIDYDFVMNDLDNLIAESQEGAERVKKIVLDLKDFSHVDKAELQYSDINKGIESTLNIVWNELKYKAKVKKDFGDLPEVYCYPQKLNQVFMNLLVNAAQAIEKKGEIRISTRFFDGDNSYVEIKISDTGSGIPEESLPKIFDPFFTTKPVGEGTGLGLNMAYNIIEKHDGRIDVESEVGKGTTFTIVLPARDESKETMSLT